MRFVFEDGEQVEIQGQQTHSFLSQDLIWAEQAHGRLVNVLYGRGTVEKSGASVVAKAITMPLSKCKELVSRSSGIFRQQGTAIHRCCA